MKLFSNNALRLVLAVSVSIWMAGGCLFGCGNNAMGAEVGEGNANLVEAGDSCHAKRAHDCCTASKPKTQAVTNLKQQLADVASFVPAPRGTMKDCPLIVNSTAVTSKSSAHVPDPGRGPVAGGQGEMAGRIFRIGHCGYYAYGDVLTALGALEHVLDELGVQVELGSGLAAAQRAMSAALAGAEG